MRLTGLLLLTTCIGAICSCGHTGHAAHGQTATNPTPGTFAAASAPAGVGGGWNAARWHALFEHVPAPPETLAQAGAMVGPVKDAHGHIQLGPTGKPLTQSRAQFKAGGDAIKAVMAASVQAERAQPGAGAARQLAQKMAGASRAERIQLAMQMAASMQRPAMNMAGLQAAGELQAYRASQSAPLHAIETNLRGGLGQIEGDYAARHAAANLALLKIIKACPPIPRCGDTTDCPPQPVCIEDVNARVPALIAQHRQLAQMELSAERAVYQRAQTALQPILGKATALATAAEQAGAPIPQRQASYAMLIGNIDLLQTADAEIVLRAGFWQGIERQPVPDSFGVYINTVPLGYRNPLGDTTGPPGKPPLGW